VAPEAIPLEAAAALHLEVGKKNLATGYQILQGGLERRHDQRAPGAGRQRRQRRHAHGGDSRLGGERLEGQDLARREEQGPLGARQPVGGLVEKALRLPVARRYHENRRLQRLVQRGGEKRAGGRDGAAQREARGALPQGLGDLTEKIGLLGHAVGVVPGVGLAIPVEFFLQPDPRALGAGRVWPRGALVDFFLPGCEGLALKQPGLLVHPGVVFLEKLRHLVKKSHRSPLPFVSRVIAIITLPAPSCQ
jgi:hypothetical protein